MVKFTKNILLASGRTGLALFFLLPYHHVDPVHPVLITLAFRDLFLHTILYSPDLGKNGTGGARPPGEPATIAG